MNERQAMLFFILGTVLILTFTFVVILFLIHHKRKQHLHLVEKHNLENLYQAQLLQTRLEVQEQAFKYISEEIHDNVGQALSMVKLQLYALKQQVNDNSQKDLVETSTEVLGKAISDLRNISHILNVGFINQVGLVKAIEKEMNYIQSSRAIDTQLTITGDVYSLPAEKELLVFRIVQEGLNNVIKHAHAAQLVVMLAYQPNQLIVTIKDDGQGFLPQKDALDKGMGIDNMKMRANMLKGNLSLQSHLNKGTTLTLNIHTQPL